MVKGIVISVIEYRDHAWRNIGLVAGVDRKVLREHALAKLQLPEIADGLRKQLGRWNEGEDLPKVDGGWRVDYAPDAPNTTKQGGGATLFFSECEILS